MTFDPFTLPDGTHFEVDPRWPDQVYTVMRHHGVVVVSEYDRRDFETPTAHSCFFNGEKSDFNELNDVLDWIDEQLGESDEDYHEEHRLRAWELI